MPSVRRPFRPCGSFSRRDGFPSRKEAARGRSQRRFRVRAVAKTAKEKIRLEKWADKGGKGASEDGETINDSRSPGSRAHANGPFLAPATDSFSFSSEYRTKDSISLYGSESGRKNRQRRGERGENPEAVLHFAKYGKDWPRPRINGGGFLRRFGGKVFVRQGPRSVVWAFCTKFAGKTARRRRKRAWRGILSVPSWVTDNLARAAGTRGPTRLWREPGTGVVRTLCGNKEEEERGGRRGEARLSPRMSTLGSLRSVMEALGAHSCSLEPRGGQEKRVFHWAMFWYGVDDGGTLCWADICAMMARWRRTKKNAMPERMTTVPMAPMTMRMT